MSITRALTAGAVLGCAGLAASRAGPAQTPAPPTTSAVQLTPCELPELGRRARCGTFKVPENPDHPAARQLSIGIAVVPATSQPVYSDPIVVLMGGPGEAAIGAAGVFAPLFESLLRHRDLLLVGHDRDRLHRQDNVPLDGLQPK